MAAVSPALHELLRSCLRGGTANDWEELLGRIQPLIARAAYRVACTAGTPQTEEIDDIVQDICLKLAVTHKDVLLRAGIESEPAAWAYIKVVALNAARDHFSRKRRRPVHFESDLELPIDQLAPTSSADPDRQILYRQIDSVLEGDTRGRQVFWLYYRQGFTAKEISAIPAVGLTAKGVESLLGRLTQAVRRALTEEPGKGKTPAEAL